MPTNRSGEGKFGVISGAVWGLAQFRAVSAFGSMVRLPLKLVPKGIEIRIWSGPMRGLRWISDSSSATCWMGVYESDKQRVFGKIVKPGQVFFDLGANVGFYTLLGSLLVGNGGRVIAFEPASRNISYLRRHLAINRIANCEVLEAAVSSKDGTALFDVAHLPVSGHISHRATESGYQVVTVAIDRLVHEGAIPGPNVIKCDIEGGEYDALLGASNTLKEYRPIVLLATHGADIHVRCCQLLRDHGYRLESLAEDKDAATSDELIGYPE